MARWLLLWLRNRVLVLLAFALAASMIGGLGLALFRLFRSEAVGVIVAGVLTAAVLVWLDSRSGWFNRTAERLLAEEREADPRPRY